MDNPPLQRRSRWLSVPEHMPAQNEESFKDFISVFHFATGHDVPKDARILVFGAGKGGLLSRLKKDGFQHVRAIDIEEQNIQGVERARIEDIRGEEYDILIGLNVFDSHHYVEQTKEVQLGMVTGILRALRPGGFLLSNGDIEQWLGVPIDGYVLDYDPTVGIDQSHVTEAVVLRKLEAL